MSKATELWNEPKVSRFESPEARSRFSKGPYRWGHEVQGIERGQFGPFVQVQLVAAHVLVAGRMVDVVIRAGVGLCPCRLLGLCTRSGGRGGGVSERDPWRCQSRAELRVRRAPAHG